MDRILDLASPVRVERVSLRGPGVIVLAGPSGSGKGELASALCALLSIPEERHLSMGGILRTTIERARSDEAYARRLEEEAMISARESIFDCIDTSRVLSAEVRRHLPDIDILFRERHEPGRSPRDFVSQLDWLEFCTLRGRLVPDRWTTTLMDARIDELTRERSEPERTLPLVLDGHPRTLEAARRLLTFLEAHDLPVLKVLHLEIDAAAMRARARGRGRIDDDDEALERRLAFYVEQVQPAIELMVRALGADRVARIDAGASIGRVVCEALRSLGIPPVIARDLGATWGEAWTPVAERVEERSE